MPPCKATASNRDSLSLDTDAQRILSCSNTLSSTVSKSTYSRSSDSRDTSRRSRTRTRGHPVGTSDDDQEVEVDASGPRSRWKRSTFGSLTRRSLSVSKVPGFSRDYGGQHDSESTDRLRSSKRLTISRPVLITKPIVSGMSLVCVVVFGTRRSFLRLHFASDICFRTFACELYISFFVTLVDKFISVESLTNGDLGSSVCQSKNQGFESQIRKWFWLWTVIYCRPTWYHT